ncbi:MAG: hypothetical protein Q6363_006495 [Candidatus Njordarchaeota archaeon]
MIIVHISGIKTKKKKPREIANVGGGEGHSYILFMNEKGEEIDTVWTPGHYHLVHYTQKNPKWLIAHTRATLTYSHVLINIEKLKALAEPSMAIHPLTKDMAITKPPKLPKKYEPLKRFGTIFTMRLEEAKKIIGKHGKLLGYAEKAMITPDQKRLCINVRGETKIYSLKNLELEEIIPQGKILWALRKANPPRKMMRMLAESNFVGMLDPKKHEKVWFIAKYAIGFPEVPVAVFIYDRDEDEVVVGPKNPLEIIWSEGIDEEYRAAKCFDKERLYDTEYLGKLTEPTVDGHIQGTYPGSAIYTIGIDFSNITKVWKNGKFDRELAKKLGLPRTHRWSIILKLNEKLEAEKYLCKIMCEDNEYICWINDEISKIQCWDNYITLHALLKPLNNPELEVLAGVVKISMDFEAREMIEQGEFQEWFLEAYGIAKMFGIEDLAEAKRELWWTLPTTSASAPSLDGNRLLVPIKISDEDYVWKRGRAEFFLFATDWKMRKIREVGVWELDPDTPVVWWTAWI